MLRGERKKKKKIRAGCFIFIWNISTCPPLFCTKPFQVQWKSMPAFKHRQHKKLLGVRNISTAPVPLLPQRKARPIAAGCEDWEQGQLVVVVDQQQLQPLTLLFLRVRKQQAQFSRKVPVAARPRSGKRSACIWKSWSNSALQNGRNHLAAPHCPRARQCLPCFHGLLRRWDPFFCRGQGSKAAVPKKATAELP